MGVEAEEGIGRGEGEVAERIRSEGGESRWFLKATQRPRGEGRGKIGRGGRTSSMVAKLKVEREMREGCG